MSSVMEDLKQLEDRILTRIQELEANVAELEELRAIAARLGLLKRGGRKTNRFRTIGTATATPRARARPAAREHASSSTRRERVLEAVAVAPGISVREVVAQLGVNRTSLYPVVRQLVSDGLLHKDGRGLWLAAR